jgi:phage virion morphogenesis protein
VADGLRVEIRDAELRRALARAIDGLEHPGDLLARIGAVLERNVQLRFETKTDPDGVPWLPIAPRTRKRYETRYDGAIPGSLLERTGHMRASLAVNATDDFVEIGFADAKAAWHETGTQRMPRRAMLLGDWVSGRLGAVDQADVLSEVNDYLGALLG